MKRLIQHLTPLIVAFVIAGCGASTHIIVGKTRPPISPDKVKIYVRPPAKYEEVALLDTSSRNSLTFTDQDKLDKAIQRLKEEAAQLGANGVLLNEVGNRLLGVVPAVSATGTPSGSASSGYGIGVGTPIYEKGASGMAIHVLVE